MKKLKVFLIFTLILLSLFLLASCDERVSNADFQLTLTADNSGYIVAKYKGGDTQVVIPSTHNGKPIKSIGGYAFSGCENITGVTIPSTITNIDAFAFEGCQSLKGVYIEDLSAWCGISFRNASSNPLYYAKKLYLNGRLAEWAVVPEGVKKINDFAFINCQSLTILSIPEGVTDIGESAFSGCENLEGIALPQSLARIGESAFENCSRLISLIIPNGVKTVGGKAFKDCADVAVITVGKGVTNIGESAFSGCTSLLQIAVSENNGAYKSFEGNLYTKDGATLVQYATGKSDASFTLPKTVINIKKGALSGCANIISFETEEENTHYKAIEGNLYTKDGATLVQYATGKSDAYFTLPQGVKRVGEGAFYGCMSLSGVILPQGITSVGEGAFYGCQNLFFEEWGNCLYLDNWLIKAMSPSIKDVEIKSTAVGIAEGAFAGCGALENIYVPNSVKHIGEGAFAGCGGLTGIVLPFAGSSADAPPDSPQKLFGYVFGANHYEGSAAAMQYYDLTLSDPYKIYYIPFNLRSVIITGGDISSRAFNNCSRLTVILLQGTAHIGEGAFNGCLSLETLTIPDGVTDIGKGAFYGCASLKEITIPNSVNYIGEGAFTGCLSLENIVLPFVGASKDGEGSAYLGYLFGTGSYQNNIDIPFSLKIVVVTASANIADFAFYNCSGLTQIAIGMGTVSIGERAFSGCAKLAAINIPQSVERIGGQAFDGCDSLTYEEEGDCLYLGSWLIKAKNASVASVTVRSGTSGIYDFAFNHCTQLTNITIGSGTVSIGESAFNGCSALESVTIPSGVKNMGSRAFYGCTSLESVVMPESLTQIKEETFYNCTSLESAVIGKGVTAIHKKAFSYCTNLKSIVIPNNVANIGDFAFESCTSLISVVIPSSVAVIKGTSFNGCENITFFCEAASKPQGWSNFWHLSDSHSLRWAGQWILSDVTPKPSNNVMFDMNGGTEGTMPIQPIAIGESAPLAANGFSRRGYTFAGWANSANGGIVYADGASYYMNADSSRTLYAKWIISDNTLIFDANGGEGNMPPQTIAYGESAPLAAIALTREGHTFVGWALTPNGVVAFADKANYIMENSQGLTLYAVWKEWTAEGIVFSESENGYIVTGFNGGGELVIPAIYNGKKVIGIGAQAFKDNALITGVIIPYSVKSIGSFAFSGCTKLTSIILPEGVTAINEGTFYYCTNLKSTVIGKGVTTIGKNAFSFCISLANIVIPNKVTNIGDFAFENCAGLTSIIIPDGVTSIGGHAFENCAGLTQLTIGNGIETIAAYAFSGCTGLTGIIIPNSIIAVDGYAFSGCRGLTQLAIGNKVEVIGENAFYGCAGLTSIIIPRSVTVIKSDSFSGCENIIFFCEAASKPQGWSELWNNSRPCYFEGEWLIVEGEPIALD